MTTQVKLNDLYRPLVDRSAVLEGLRRRQASEAVLKELNGPFLIAVDDQYEAFLPRIAIVGQENNGWLDYDYLIFLTQHGIEDALSVYRNFNIAEYGSGFFGRYFAMLRDRLLGAPSDSTKRAIIYNNLFKLNHNGKHCIKSPHLETMLELQSDIFVGEMELLAPDVLIFLTGPDYDFIIKRFYPDAVFQQVDSHPPNEIAQVTASRLRGLAFRTYHPGYLNRVISTKPHCMDAIVERVKSRFP